MSLFKRAWTWVAIGLLGAVFLSLLRMGLLDIAELGPALGRLAHFASGLVPPQTSVLPNLLSAMLETIEIAFVGTLLGFIMSLPFAFFSSRAIWPGSVTAVARAGVALFRTIPSILYGVIFVVGFGLGPAAGTLAVAFYTIGYLAKLFYEAFDAVDPEIMEAVRTTGAGRLQLWCLAILPESMNAILSQLLSMFEYNIRASTLMGFVGAGGIGYYMLRYVQLLQHQQLCMALPLTIVVVMRIDTLSQRLTS